MARVHHTNVVQVHDSGTVDGRPYLVMEYIEGGDLRGRMEPGRLLPSDQVRPLVLPVAQALTCLHAHGIVHRDLKPENIMMHHGCTPMLTDFGLAVLDTDAGRLTRTDGLMGTPGYVAPEQQYGLGVDERADQYSMAAVIYELLTGHRPLGILKPPSQLNPGLGPGVDTVLLRALQEDPDDRYPTVQEFAVALDRALSTPEAEIEVGPRRRLSRRAGAIFAVMALTLVAAAVGFRAWKAPVEPAGDRRRGRLLPLLAPAPRSRHVHAGPTAPADQRPGHDAGPGSRRRVPDGVTRFGPRRQGHREAKAPGADFPAVLPGGPRGHRRPVPRLRLGHRLSDRGRGQW